MVARTDAQEDDVTELRPCSRCRERPASTARNAYCKSCRAAYQREWRARKKSVDTVVTRHAPEPANDNSQPAELLRRVRLRGTPTRAEMLRFRLT
jgi:hypothetical protein